MRKALYTSSCLLSYILVGIGLLLGPDAWGQKAPEISANLTFQEDTFAVGRPIQLRMSIRHPADVVVVFPESKEFAPFELVSFEPEPTQTLDGFSWDIVMYQVRSFMLEDKQALKLPYAYYEGKDTVRRFAMTDSIILIRRVTGGEDRTAFKLQNTLESLEDPPNYFRIFLLVSGIVSLLLGLLLMLRRPIKRYLRIRRNRLDWLSFKRRLREIENTFDQTKLFEQLTQLWKGFLDPTDEFGYRSMTTTEFKSAILKRQDFTLEQQQILTEAAQLADRSIYAGERIQPHLITNILIQIKNVMSYVYLDRAKELKKQKN